MRTTSLTITALLIYSTILIAQTSSADSTGRPAAITADSARALRPEAKAGIEDSAGRAEAKPKPPKPKSIKRAFFLSLAVPGAGEYYVGQKRYTKGFLASEALIWSFALLSRYQGSMWKDDYIALAAQAAGANPGREDDLYYQNIYEWPNSDWYNEYQWAEARDLYPGDPAAQAAYVADKLYSAVDAWEWGSDEDWDRFRGLRVKSESAYRRVTYAAGAALLNHMLSAVNAARLAKSHNDKLPRKRRLSMDLSVLPTWNGGVALNLSGRF